MVVLARERGLLIEDSPCSGHIRICSPGTVQRGGTLISAKLGIKLVCKASLVRRITIINNQYCVRFSMETEFCLPGGR
jgi:hypothetical protein